MSEILHDLRFGVRMLRKRPGASVLAIVALGLGIGLTTTMFSIVQGVILRGLPFEGSERILHVGRVLRTNPGDTTQVPPHDYVDWQRTQRSFEEMGAYRGVSAIVTGGLAAERYRGTLISTNTLHILRTAPALGRDLVDADAQPGAPAVALISHRIWTSQFESDPSVLNRTVRINGVPTVIVGVMPERFGFPNATDLWMPLRVELPARRGAGAHLDVVGRLKIDVSLTQARAEFDTISRTLAAEHRENTDAAARLQPFMDRILGEDIRRTFYTMLTAVLGVMLIACANVTNLQLARAAERTREMAVRTALGAGRARLIRQLLIEGLILATAGTALGLGISLVGIQLFNAGIADTSPPFWIDVRIDMVVLAFVSGLTIIATLAASLLPSLRATRQHVHDVLKDEGRSNTGVYMGRFSRGLIVAQVFVSCCLLIVSGLMIKSMVLIGWATYPYATEDVFVASVSALEQKYAEPADRMRFAADLEERLRAVTGVRHVALSTGLPASTGLESIRMEGDTPTSGSTASALLFAATASMLDTLGFDVRQGRRFTSADTHEAPRVAIVSEDFVSRFSSGTNPLGRRFRTSDEPGAPWWTIVGVFPPLVQKRAGRTTELVIVPLAQRPALELTLLASTAGDPVALTPAVRRAVASLDPDLALSAPSSLEEAYRQNSWPLRVFGSLFLSFGFAALLLASAGLYGVLSFTVKRRTQEIGIRMALGADRSDVLRMILRQGLWRVGFGVVLGLLPAWWLARAMRELLFGVEPLDPLVFGLTTACLLGSGFLASIVPARRAASVDPVVALRHD